MSLLNLAAAKGDCWDPGCIQRGFFGEFRICSMFGFAGFVTDFAHCGLRSTDYKVPTKSQGQSRLYIQIALLVYFCMNEYNAGGVLEKD